MLIRSKISGQSEWLFVEDIMDTPMRHAPLAEKQIAIRKYPVNMVNHQLSTGGMLVMYSTMNFEEPVNIHVEVEGEAITSQFVFYHKQTGRLQQEKVSFDGRGRHNIRYIPSTSEDHLIKPEWSYAYFLVVLSKEYYFNLVDRQSLLHEDFVRRIAHGRYTSFSEEDMYVTPEMRKVMHDIVVCRQQGELRRIHTEARILELLMYQLEQLSNRLTVADEVIHSDDIEKLEKARQILNQRYADPPTQKELSLELMLNEFKLRRGFKEYFGATVHDYTTRVRMDHARLLLLKGNLSVYEVAAAVGFSHQNNFSAAFKKYYGIPPSEVKA